GLNPDDPIQWAWIMLATVATSTVIWLGVTYLTAPEDDEVLESFYERVRPGGPGWRRISEATGHGRESMAGGPLNWTNWVAGVTSVYATLFGTGRLIFGEWGSAALFLSLAVVSFAWIGWNMGRGERAETARMGASPSAEGTERPVGGPS
ncbi:MAG: hypothetical protein R3223_13370, partial [Longimicrobiales bacterium]|nr:hypothetical protein [Longimicrobiales bacterium]